jgi:hypothetical protein
MKRSEQKEVADLTQPLIDIYFSIFSQITFPLMTDFTVLIGTYERLLYGIECTHDAQSNTIQSKLSIAYATHIGCIKTVATGGPYLASGSTDEVIK